MQSRQDSAISLVRSHSNWSDQTQSYYRAWSWIRAFRHELVGNWMWCPVNNTESSLDKLWHKSSCWVMTRVFLLSFDTSVTTELWHENSYWVMTRGFLLSYDTSIPIELWYEDSYWVLTRVFILSNDSRIPTELLHEDSYWVMTRVFTLSYDTCIHT